MATLGRSLGKPSFSFLNAPLFPKMAGDETTLEFYGREAERYCERTGSTPTATLGAFLGRLPHGATILELGCGSRTR